MKKIIAALTALSMLVSFASCKGDESPDIVSQITANEETVNIEASDEITEAVSSGEMTPENTTNKDETSDGTTSVEIQDNPSA